jgi:hypothetical protein
MEKTQATPAWKTPPAFPTLPQLPLRDKFVFTNVRKLGAGHVDAARCPW